MAQHLRLAGSGQLQQSLSFIERTAWARYAYVVLLLVIGPVGLWSAWDDASASTSVLHHRLFLIGAGLVWAIVAVTLALVPWWQETRAWLIAAHLLIMGLYLGLGQVLKLLRFGASPLRSLRSRQVPAPIPR